MTNNRKILSNFDSQMNVCLHFIYSQTCVQRPPLGPEKRGRYAEGCMKKISGK
jgi:hypothetical protein